MAVLEGVVAGMSIRSDVSRPSHAAITHGSHVTHSRSRTHAIVLDIPQTARNDCHHTSTCQFVIEQPPVPLKNVNTHDSEPDASR